MSKLSEEEIIEEVKKELRLAKNVDDIATTIRNEYVRGLLDLYNKEKEKNKILEANGFRKGLYEKDCNYISKDKIREKIEEYEEFVNEFEEYWSKDPRQFRKNKSVDYYKIEALRELLEEE